VLCPTLLLDRIIIIPEHLHPSTILPTLGVQLRIAIRTQVTEVPRIVVSIVSVPVIQNQRESRVYPDERSVMELASIIIAAPNNAVLFPPRLIVT
jgi:hypothetical protein